MTDHGGGGGGGGVDAVCKVKYGMVLFLVLDKLEWLWAYMYLYPDSCF